MGACRPDRFNRAGPWVRSHRLITALLWGRLTGRSTPRDDQPDGATGVRLLLAIFGLIAIVVGVQGLFTPDG
ncbi:hypothetical protein DLJ58_05115 [Micromonospora arida]|uniref:Uncharacterized protein n=1 Tax=Micromonospora arida TaxID=2203715 RepID=A0A3N9XI22_9ACTN|nr:hypothetical protein DLJ58_05115 [Micromonospora arida]